MGCICECIYTVLVKVYVYIKKQASAKICYSRGASPPNPREKQGLPVLCTKNIVLYIKNSFINALCT